MRVLRYNRILAGTALALILTAPTGAAYAAADTPAALDAAVPMPGSPPLPPPTAADIGPSRDVPAITGLSWTRTQAESRKSRAATSIPAIGPRDAST